LVESKPAEGNTESFVGRSGFYELKAITKGVALAHQGVDLNRPEIYGELQPNHYSQRNFLEQHCGYACFADVYRASADDVAIARINANRNFQLEAGMSAILGCELRWGNSGLSMRVHFANCHRLVSKRRRII
jgi:hypothetical protein